MTFYLSELWQKGPTVVLAVTGILLGALSFVLLLVSRLKFAIPLKSRPAMCLPMVL
jgi:hypothetical protein